RPRPRATAPDTSPRSTDTVACPCCAVIALEQSRTVKAATRTSGRPRRGARDRCPWGSTSATSPARSPDGGVALAGGGRPGSTRPPRPATGRAVTVGNGAAIPRGRAAGRPRTRHPADSCTEAPDPIGGGGFHRETSRCRPSVNRPSGVSPGRRRKAGWPAGTPIREARAHRPRSAPAGGQAARPGHRSSCPRTRQGLLRQPLLLLDPVERHVRVLLRLWVGGRAPLLRDHPDVLVVHPGGAARFAFLGVVGDHDRILRVGVARLLPGRRLRQEGLLD